MAVAATWITYFAALYLNFCDFSRYATDEKALARATSGACRSTCWPSALSPA
jgi:cytosine/uracil/thiamine/allantoin permease